MKKNEFAEPIGQHAQLNPKIWQRDRLRSEVRGALLRIAQDFLGFVEVPVEVLDIVITGGNANYTYTAHSDIDLHIIADLDRVDCDREAQELFDTKRLLYKKNYDVSIHGIPVELYIENVDTPAVSSGQYSIQHDRWQRQPKQVDPNDYNQKAVEHWVNVWRQVLQHAIQTGDLQTCRTSVNLLKQYRRLGLRTADAEFSVPNLVYKSLRNDHTIEAIMRLINRLHERELSLKP
jgi:hypothetical protein